MQKPEKMRYMLCAALVLLPGLFARPMVTPPVKFWSTISNPKNAAPYHALPACRLLGHRFYSFFLGALKERSTMSCGSEETP